MNGLNTHTHRNGLQTEVDAFVKASKRMESTKSKIIFEIGCAGENGLTPDEFVENYGGLINTVRRRFTDLWKEGKIKHHPTLLERKNRAGNNCVTWVIGKDEKSVSIKSKREWVGLTEEEIADLIRADEREACAKLCDEVGEHPSLTPRHCAEAIRARGNT